MSNKSSTPYTSIVDRPLSTGKSEVSLSIYGYLFSSIVQYSILRVSSGEDLENRLSTLGYNIGIKLLELIIHRDKSNKKEIKLVNMLQFITTTIWKTIFNKVADGLEKSENHDNEYYIWDNNPITNKWISVPKDMGELNCASFIGGIIHGVLDSANFPCKVVTHLVPVSDKYKTTYVVQFEKSVIDREIRDK